MENQVAFDCKMFDGLLGIWAEGDEFGIGSKILPTVGEGNNWECLVTVGVGLIVDSRL